MKQILWSILIGAVIGFAADTGILIYVTAVQNRRLADDKAFEERQEKQIQDAEFAAMRATAMTDTCVEVSNNIIYSIIHMAHENDDAGTP